MLAFTLMETFWLNNANDKTNSWKGAPGGYGKFKFKRYSN